MEAGVVGCGMIRALRRTGGARGPRVGRPRCAGESGQGRGFFPLPAGGPAGAVGQLRKKRVGGVKGWAGCRDNTGQAPADARAGRGAGARAGPGR